MGQGRRRAVEGGGWSEILEVLYSRDWREAEEYESRFETLYPCTVVDHEDDKYNSSQGRPNLYKVRITARTDQSLSLTK